MSQVNWKQFGSRMVEARKSRGMTQTDLANESGFCNSFISKLENGRARAESRSIRGLAKALNRTPEWLLGRDSGTGIPRDQPRQDVQAEIVTVEEMMMLSAYRKLSDPEVRKTHLAMLRAMAKGMDDQDR